jgi:hypothetical protein
LDLTTQQVVLSEERETFHCLRNTKRLSLTFAGRAAGELWGYVNRLRYPDEVMRLWGC